MAYYTNGKLAGLYKLHHVYTSAGALVDDLWGHPQYKQDGCGWTYGTQFTTRAATAGAIRDGIASDLVRKVSAEVRDKVSAAMDASDLTGYSARRRRVFTDGGEPCVDRLMDRRDDWGVESRRGRPVRVVRIGVNICVSCGNTEEDFARLVGTACAIADAIDKLGHASEVVGIIAGEYGWGIPYCVSFPMKQAGEPMDIERVGTLGLPGLFREFFFQKFLRDIEPGNHSIGTARVASESDLKSCTDIDYLISRHWANSTQTEIYEGVTGILQGAGIGNGG